MTTQDAASYRKALKEVSRKTSSSQAAARKFLASAGIITPKGNLRKPYR
jgi:hypothetical protein